MAECPFCGSGVSEDLITYGGTCPKCFAEVPGEEAPTDPGEEVRAAQERTDRRRATLRAAISLMAMLVVVSCTGVTALTVALWPEPEVVEIVDFDELDFAMPEVIDGEGTVTRFDEEGRAIAGSSGVLGGNGNGGGTAGSSGGTAGSSGGTVGAGGGTAGSNRPGEIGGGGGTTAGGFDEDDPRVASVVGGPGTAGANGRDGSSSGGAGSTSAGRLAEGFAPKGIDGGTSGIENLGGEDDRDSSGGLGPRGMGEGPSDPTRSIGLKSGQGGRGKSDLSIGAPNVNRDQTTVYEDRDAIIFMIGERMVQQIPGLNNCYERRLKVDSQLQGRWRLDFTVTEDGSVARASATGLNGRDAELESCITNMIETKWRFAKVAYDVPVRRTLTFRPN